MVPVVFCVGTVERYKCVESGVTHVEISSNRRVYTYRSPSLTMKVVARVLSEP